MPGAPLTRSTTLSEVVTSAVESRIGQAYHCLPAIVVAYYPTTFEADVQIAVNDPRFDPDTDARIDEGWPIYPKVRVAWPSFNGFILAAPLTAGDSVQVFFQDLDDSAFRSSGQVSSPVNTRRFSPDASFILPFSVADAAKPGSATLTNATTGLVIGKDGTPQIVINGTMIQLGAAGGDFVALASKVDALFSGLKTYLDAHVHTSAASGSPTSPPTVHSPSPNPTGSTVVAAQ